MLLFRPFHDSFINIILLSDSENSDNNLFISDDDDNDFEVIRPSSSKKRQRAAISDEEELPKKRAMKIKQKRMKRDDCDEQESGEEDDSSYSRKRATKKIKMTPIISLKHKKPRAESDDADDSEEVKKRESKKKRERAIKAHNDDIYAILEKKKDKFVSKKNDVMMVSLLPNVVKELRNIVLDIYFDKISNLIAVHHKESESLMVYVKYLVGENKLLRCFNDTIFNFIEQLNNEDVMKIVNQVQLVTSDFIGNYNHVATNLNYDSKIEELRVKLGKSNPEESLILYLQTVYRMNSLASSLMMNIMTLSKVKNLNFLTHLQVIVVSSKIDSLMKIAEIDQWISYSPYAKAMKGEDDVQKVVNINGLFLLPLKKVNRDFVSYEAGIPQFNDFVRKSVLNNLLDNPNYNIPVYINISPRRDMKTFKCLNDNLYLGLISGFKYELKEIKERLCVIIKFNVVILFEGEE